VFHRPVALVMLESWPIMSQAFTVGRPTREVLARPFASIATPRMKSAGLRGLLGSWRSLKNAAPAIDSH